MAYVYDYPGAHDQTTYDLENQIADPDQRIERFMESVVPLDGVALADVGAGGGYHACRFAQTAAHVYAIEPAPKMLRQLYDRVGASGLTNVSVIAAPAQEVPLRDGLVDVVHSRFAYFFGPEGGTVGTCEPGIAEAMRILTPGGAFFIIDNAFTTGQFAGILARYGYTRGQAAEAQRQHDEFYAARGFQHTTVESTWTAPHRDDLRQVLTMEFPGQPIDVIMDDIEGSDLSYHYRVYYRRK
jgi:ubiquinone/menaquinone biosynthesis C-methylase UbiE